MSYYPEPGCHIRNEVKVELDLANYATKKELEQARGADTNHLAPNKYCFESWSWQTTYY